MSDGRALRARLEALQAELALAEAGDGRLRTEALEAAAARLAPLHAQVAELARRAAQTEEFLADAVRDLREAQQVELSTWERGSPRRRGPPVGPVFFGWVLGGMLGLSPAGAELPLAVVGALIAVSAGAAAWLGSRRARLARAIDEAQRFL